MSRRSRTRAQGVRRTVRSQAGRGFTPVRFTAPRSRLWLLPRPSPAGLFTPAIAGRRPPPEWYHAPPPVVLVSGSRRISPRTLRRSQDLRSSLLRLGAHPRSTPCDRRRSRREVLFSRDVAGRRWGSGGGPKAPRFRNLFSNYSCR